LRTFCAAAEITTASNFHIGWIVFVWTCLQNLVDYTSLLKICHRSFHYA